MGVDLRELIDDPDLIGPPTQEIPARDEFLRALGVVDGKAVALLRVLLARCNPVAEFPQQLLAIDQIGRWIISGPAVPATHAHPVLIRLEMLVAALERIPSARHRFCASLHSVLVNTRAIKLFGEVGLPNDRGLLAEATDRLARLVLPEAPALHELWMLAGRIIRKLDDLAWLGPAADPLLHRMANVGGPVWEPLRTSVQDAISMIATRIAAQGMAEAFRSHARGGAIRESPLYHLTRANPTEMPALIELSRRHLDRVRVALEEHGVSIDVVYALDSIERGLARIELLLPFVDGTDHLEPTYEIRSVIAAVGRGLAGAHSFRQLLSDNLRLLARKVIERAGRTGEHYVTSSKREYWKMLGSAFGGGVLTLGTGVAKFFVKWGHWPLFIDGVLSSSIYAGSFVIMQLLGFTLATKQPSMTAASLAGTIRDRAGADRLEQLVPLIARIARSQFEAALGNVTGVTITALTFDLLYRLATGHSFLDAAGAKGVVEAFNPLGSGTIFFAALTGVLLWLSSLVAGWFENWIVYRRLPAAIEHHRFGKRLGQARMARWARFLEHEAAGFGGSISLGVLLGMTPVFAKFFGLPLDVRHITLSTGSLTLAMSSLGIAGAGWGPFISAVIGIAIIGVLNFGVSFTLALLIALRARDVPAGEGRALPFAVLKRFFRKPLEFFYPPNEPVSTKSPTNSTN